MNFKVKCDECDWQGMNEEILTAQNPFDVEDNISIYGCPQCKSSIKLVSVCDEPYCWEYSSCGTPTADGYRRTCGKHKPIEETT